jgi:ADP-L-glycero-D-manno-heptose 6-epimerase
LFERHVKNFYDSGIIIQGFRYFNVYGKYEDHKGDQASPFHKFSQQAKNEGKIKLFTNSENYHRDFVPVEQVVSMHEKFFSVKESGVWNIGTGKTQSFLEVAKKFNVPIEYIDMPKEIQKSYQRYTCASMEKTNLTLMTV